ncbi:hypothetical protein BaRGS_00009120 [Batillaria attramentaria]|uniref:Secreted protein n=1 Tax=Batillaria attramentaria TaxID=370345 RepID=A0ABD0LJX3_9CAEN
MQTVPHVLRARRSALFSSPALWMFSGRRTDSTRRTRFHRSRADDKYTPATSTVHADCTGGGPVDWPMVTWTFLGRQLLKWYLGPYLPPSTRPTPQDNPDPPSLPARRWRLGSGACRLTQFVSERRSMTGEKRIGGCA